MFIRSPVVLKLCNFSLPGPDRMDNLNERSQLVNAGHRQARASRPRLREARPRQQVGAVGVHAGRELRVEDEVPEGPNSE
jgi:hypothetical protein